MTNAANLWIKKAFKRLKYSFPFICKCKICKNTPIKQMEFSHERATKLSKGNNGNPRGRKEKYYDILRHPRSYKLRAHKCHMKNKRDQHRRFRKEAKERRP